MVSFVGVMVALFDMSLTLDCFDASLEIVDVDVDDAAAEGSVASAALGLDADLIAKVEGEIDRIA